MPDLRDLLSSEAERLRPQSVPPFDEVLARRRRIQAWTLREGVLYDILGRDSEHDPRDASIRALAERYDVDGELLVVVESVAATVVSVVVVATMVVVPAPMTWMLGSSRRL